MMARWSCHLCTIFSVTRYRKILEDIWQVVSVLQDYPKILFFGFGLVLVADDFVVDQLRRTSTSTTS